MNTPHFRSTHRRTATWFASTVAAAAQIVLLSACGGGGASPDSAEISTPAAAPLADSVTTLQVQADTLPPEAAALVAAPTFHMAPVVLDAPDDTDVRDPSASARRAPLRSTVPADLQDLPTRGLTLQGLESARRSRALGAGGSTVKPAAGGSVAATYTPAQIRAAYGLPTLPAGGTTLTTEQAAQLGAGQTIYIVNAKHDPNIAAELAAFNQRFGLPTCTTKSIAATATLPLAAASATACEFSVVYSTMAAGMTTTAPGYDAGWATEIALDVQWAHATAPLARIVLIEAPDATLDSLLGAIKLANKMGPGVVSMSFGSNEGTYTTSADSAFTGTGMTYLAATGDSGYGVSWPAVSTKVLAVGGTTLSYSGSGARSETVWSGSGGGTSAYTATPSYQAVGLPGVGSVTRRTVPDIAFNANPSSGQYVAVQSQGSSTVQWSSVGGTSLSTPQWAGLVAVANALRAQGKKEMLGTGHSYFYSQIARVPGTYASVFADIVSGSNGSCSNCTARVGYDAQTGLGTPNVTSLFSTLTGLAPAPVAPVVTPATITADAGKAVSFTANVSAPNAYTCTLSGAPSGMVVAASTCAVSWPVSVAGSYAVTVTAKDSKTGLSGQGLYTVSISAPKPPTPAGGTISGTVGKALSFGASVTWVNPVTYTLSGAPSGMAISSSGTVTWANPVAGSYKVTVTAKDSKTSLSGQGVYTVQITTATTTTTTGPSITAPALTGLAGKALSGTITIATNTAGNYSVSIMGVPMGMTFAPSGSKLQVNWTSPVAGSYALKISVIDSQGRSASASMPITINAK